MTEINPGDVRRVSGSFTNPAGVATDPTTISVRWRHHRGTETTWVYGTDTQVVRDSAGVFHADIPITASGLYYYKFSGTGTVTASEEGTFLAETFFESVAPSTLTGPIRLYTGTADPTTGAGVPAAIGSVYSRTLLGSESVWVKTGAADAGWVQSGSVGGGGGGGGLPSQWAVDDDGGLVLNYEDTTGIVPAVQVEYLGDPADYIPLVRLGDPGAPTFVIDSSGDSDFRFGDSAVSTKWTDATNPAAAANVAKIGQSDSFIGPPTGYFQLVYGDQLFIQAGATTLMQFLFTGGGSVLLPNLPTADPHVAGQVWNDTGTLKLSAG